MSMATAAVQQQQAVGPVCWCRGNRFEDSDLTRLGTHPEVGCAPVRTLADRRARSAADTRRRTSGAWVRRSVDLARGWVIVAGAHDWPADQVAAGAP